MILIHQKDGDLARGAPLRAGQLGGAPSLSPIRSSLGRGSSSGSGGF